MPRPTKRLLCIVLTALVLAGACFLADNIQRREAADPSSVSYDTSGRFMLDIIDCGQGDAILAKTPDGFCILVDAGDIGSRDAVLAELRSQKVDALDMLVITHPHADHIGGMQAVLGGFPVEKVLLSGIAHTTDLYMNLLEEIQQRDIPEEKAVPGKSYTFGTLRAEVLGPLEDYEELNDSSVVLRLEYGKNAFLLMGDAEGDAEADMLDTYGSLNADVLKVAHHGSGSSTSGKFLKAMAPKIAAISVGEGNGFGHPDAATLKRLGKYRVDVYRTDESGCIRFYSDGTTVEVKTER